MNEGTALEGNSGTWQKPGIWQGPSSGTSSHDKKLNKNRWKRQRLVQEAREGMAVEKAHSPID